MVYKDTKCVGCFVTISIEYHKICC
jgi:hypothetical protein